MVDLATMDAPALRARIIELEAQLARKKPAKAKGLVDLNMAVGRPKKTAQIISAVCTWADASTTKQHAAFNKDGERWPAAFQACDRLRRLRTRYTLGWSTFMAPIKGPNGVLLLPEGYYRFLALRPMPALVSIWDEDTDEEFLPGRDYGTGDAEAAQSALDAARLVSEMRYEAPLREREKAIAAWKAQMAKVEGSPA